MSTSLFYTIYWPILMAISISKPISDFFWLQKFKSAAGSVSALRRLLQEMSGERYITMLIFGTAFWALSNLVVGTFFNNNFLYEMVMLSLFTFIFMGVTISFIKSILVIGLISITFANFGLIGLFLPITDVDNLDTLNNFLSNLISTFNYAAVATAGLGLVWQFGRHNNEKVYETISTMFYALGYIFLNMLISFLTLFVPTISGIIENS